MVKVGDTIKIIYMDGEPSYTGKTGVVRRISRDPWGDTAIYGSWGGCALYEGKDRYTVINGGNNDD